MKSPRMLLAALFLLVIGGGLSLWRSHTQKPSQIKSVDEYWAETGLGPSSLEDLIQDQTCRTSERYFLACANSVLTVANRYNLSLATDGMLTTVDPTLAVDMSSEKKQLEPWREFFNKEPKKAMQFSFMRVWKKLQEKFVSEKQTSLMVGIGLNGFISVFRDPHTYLMPVSLFREVISKADNQSSSLGIVLGRVADNYVVRKVMEGTPAKKVGIQKGDVLLEINGQAVAGLLQARVSELLKGDIGSQATLRVQRENEKLKFKMTRTEVVVATVSLRVIDGIRPIGVVAINKFAKGACEKTKEILNLAKKSHVRGMLLDLRDNPGGQMEEAACIAGLFVGDKKIFEIRYLNPEKHPEIYTGGEEQIFDKPLAILVNAGSASAAEIVAGSLRDLNRAVLVGERTFGKGSFQEGEYWTQNKKIALFETKGFYYLPSGRSPQMQGLTPDVPVSFDNILVSREDDQFANPLRAQEHQLKPVRSLLSLNDCLESSDTSPADDLQVSKARQILFCTRAASGGVHD